MTTGDTRDTESAIQRAILLACNRDGVRLFRCNTGTGWTGNVIERTMHTITLMHPRPLHAGLVTGGADLIGWAADGRFCAVEVKTKRGTVSDDQRAFLEAVTRMGGRAGVARSVLEAEQIVGLAPPPVIVSGPARKRNSTSTRTIIY